MRNGFIALDPRLSPPTTAIRQTKNGLVTLLCDSTGHPESRFPLVDCDQFRYVIRQPESLIGDDLEITNLPVKFLSVEIPRHQFTPIVGRISDQLDFVRLWLVGHPGPWIPASDLLAEWPRRRRRRRSRVVDQRVDRPECGSRFGDGFADAAGIGEKERSRIHPPKSARERKLPLPEEVGRSLPEYVQNSRPKSDETLPRPGHFVRRERPPLDGLPLSWR